MVGSGEFDEEDSRSPTKKFGISDENDDDLSFSKNLSEKSKNVE